VPVRLHVPAGVVRVQVEDVGGSHALETAALAGADQCRVVRIGVP
jgi:hypothetical protein